MRLFRVLLASVLTALILGAPVVAIYFGGVLQ
ncbi:hypothetical protein SAMN04515672_0183 [Natronorubrum texcoconense]|uniref:Uncharacterized protein n=1 Tax=Natronorubrum texcoconense TaxID=1095776 RepID=A0A1G9HB35_9EURY|nr:hypothetical protein SAMN04515672_0183 [Natronorubrum texcoconense]